MEPNYLLQSFIHTLTKDMEKDELHFLYLVYNFLILVTENPQKNIFLTDDEAKLIHQSFIKSKQVFVKEIYKNQDRMNDLIQTIHINSNFK